MFLSGLIGSSTGIPIFYYSTPFGYTYPSGLWYHATFAVLAGVFTCAGVFCKFGAVNIGSAEVAQLFVNMKPIVQLIEEAIFLFIFPNLWAVIGILIAIFGACLVIFGKRETDNQHERSDAKLDEK